jgi:DNA repair protein RadC
MKTIKKYEIRSSRIQVGEMEQPYCAAFNAPVDVIKAARSILSGEDQEVFLVFLLDTKNKVLGYQEVARGAVEGCLVDPRVVFRAAVVLGASGVILCHCHPSGDPDPSTEDITLTKRMMYVGDLLGVQVLDHIVFGSTGGKYVSLSERGFIKEVRAT